MEMCLSSFRTDLGTGGQAFSTTEEPLLLGHLGADRGSEASGPPPPRPPRPPQVPAESGASTRGRTQTAFSLSSDWQLSFTYLFSR